MTISEKRNVSRFLGNKMICSAWEHIILLLGETQEDMSSRSMSLSSGWVGEIDIEVISQGLWEVSVIGVSDTSQGYSGTHQEQKDDSRKKPGEYQHERVKSRKRN